MSSHTPEIERAQGILSGMEASRSSQQRGAFGLQSGGETEMIDEPMVKQVRSVSVPTATLVLKTGMTRTGTEDVCEEDGAVE